jgi:glycine oxidase
MLAAHMEADPRGPLFELCQRSRALFPDFVSSLHDETGIDAELARGGTIVPILDDADARRFEPILGAGARAERLEAAALSRLEPWLSPECRLGLHLPDDLRVNNRRLCDALVASLQRRGVAFRLGRGAIAVTREGSAATGVRLAGGETVAAGAVVVAAGAWSALLDGLPRPLPVEPRRGQMLALAAPAGALRHSLFGGSGYLVPRADGSVVVGSTVERVGFDRRVTAGGIASLLAAARRLVPRLEGAELLETWAGLRPGTPDDLPILGPDPEVAGLVYATGHFRSGILLTPVTAQLVLEAVTGARSILSTDPFRPERFAGASTPSAPRS